jgi:hypothetical protein
MVGDGDLEGTPSCSGHTDKMGYLLTSYMSQQMGVLRVTQVKNKRVENGLKARLTKTGSRRWSVWFFG